MEEAMFDVVARNGLSKPSPFKSVAERCRSMPLCNSKRCRR